MDSEFNFGDRLKQIRLDHNLSQEKLARELDVTSRNYQHWEHGTRYPAFEYIRKLSLLFNVSADYLLGMVDEPLPIGH